MQKTGNPSRALVLALGNPLSGDDGFGSQVLAALRRQETVTMAGVTFVDAHTDLLNHIDSFSEYDQVVLIDAILDPEGKLGQAGGTRVLPEEEFLRWSGTSESVHQMSPLLTIQLFRQLYPGARTRIWLVGLLVDEITHAPRYSSERCVREASGLISNILNG
jgi:hydrogenase maturation protease